MKAYIFGRINKLLSTTRIFYYYIDVIEPIFFTLNKENFEDYMRGEER